jgi:hypothetical protein
VAFPMIYAGTYVTSGRDNIYLIIFYNVNSLLKRYLSYIVVFLECIQIVLILEIYRFVSVLSWREGQSIAEHFKFGVCWHGIGSLIIVKDPCPEFGKSFLLLLPPFMSIWGYNL